MQTLWMTTVRWLVAIPLAAMTIALMGLALVVIRYTDGPDA